MCFHDSSAFAGPSIFDAPTDDPQLAVISPLAEIEDDGLRYAASGDVLDGLLLLNDIEGLRRFVLVRSNTCAWRWPAAAAIDAPPLGRMLCEALHRMIGDVPSLVTKLHQARSPQHGARHAAGHRLPQLSGKPGSALSVMPGCVTEQI